MKTPHVARQLPEICSVTKINPGREFVLSSDINPSHERPLAHQHQKLKNSRWVPKILSLK